MIRFIKIIVFIVPGLLLGCIEEYFPESDSNSGKIVIDGKLTDVPGIQVVRISRSTSISDPHFQPVSGCIVEVSDIQGNTFRYNEVNKGIYHREFMAHEVEIGEHYALHVVSPEGDEYCSDHVMMTDCPPVDTVYYREESLVSLEEDFNDEGVQFYVNINAGANDSRYYAYQLEETWETYTPLTIEYIYDSARVMTAPDYLSGLNHCWMRGIVEKFHVASTHDKTENKLTGIPLHYVSSNTARLKHKYCLQVNQL